MISRIRGTLLTRDPERVEVMTGGGVGYELEIPLSVFMMSTLTPSALVRAITDRELATLVQVPGVGKKTAERIALELGDKLDDLALRAGPSVKGAAAQEAVGALVALGYASSEANAAVRRSIEQDGPEEDPKVLIRKALAHASG